MALILCSRRMKVRNIIVSAQVELFKKMLASAKLVLFYVNYKDLNKM